MENKITIDSLLWVLSKEVAKLRKAVEGDDDGEQLLVSSIIIDALADKLASMSEK